MQSFSEFSKEQYVEAVDEWLASGEPVLQFHDYLKEYESKLNEDYDELMWNFRGD